MPVRVTTWHDLRVCHTRLDAGKYLHSRAAKRLGFEQRVVYSTGDGQMGAKHHGNCRGLRAFSMICVAAGISRNSTWPSAKRMFTPSVTLPGRS